MENNLKTRDLVEENQALILRRMDQIVNKIYLPYLESCEIVKYGEEIELWNVTDNACFFQLKQIVFDKKEDVLQALTSVYSGAAAIGADLVYLIRGFSSGEVELYLGVCGEQSRMNGTYTKAAALFNHFMGQFPGSRSAETHIMTREETRIMMNKCFDKDYRSVSAVSCIASCRKGLFMKEREGFNQGIEKVIETMRGGDFTIMALANPLHTNDVCAIRRELEDLYSKLSPFSKVSISANQSEAKSTTEMLTESMSESISHTKSLSFSLGSSNSDSQSEGSSESISLGANIYGAFGSYTYGVNQGSAHTKSVSKGRSDNRGETVTKNEAQGQSYGKSHAVTSGKAIQYTVESKDVGSILENITQHLARIKTGGGIGMFSSAVYIMAPTVSEARTAACIYKANISGDNTPMEYTAINTWQYKEYVEIVNYLRRFKHPAFLLKQDGGFAATPATFLTSAELAIQMSMPQKSINGVAVRESVSFGRNITMLDANGSGRSVQIGNIYHLGYVEKNAVALDADSLAMHTFVTGTTGSGKSNAVYELLSRINATNKEIHFLVIEPAKGEYKTAFADRKDVKVYGVNPYITPLLRLNPFRFNKHVHVLEHIDRLVSIFNVCWPMEAAMPAILKQAIERAYEKAGWDLYRSLNKYSASLFPEFTDVMQEVERILDESMYSDENKGNYIGALCTRLRELTSGLNSMIFSADELSDNDIFEENVIVDLSRIGSPETKALIMGLLVIRLQEYRLMGQKNLQGGLRHVTILEEAHHLLKRTSTEQALESANMMGKSVEMLTNAFAEMRSSGEGFIIVDQSPGLMDMSVIRNTNTKIVLRLPAQEDRELLGSSMGLNKDQIMEIAKLPTGVAAVYQNNWVEAILVKFPYHPSGYAEYDNRIDESVFENEMKSSLLDAIMRNSIEAMTDQIGGNKVEAIAKSRLSTPVKRHLIEYIQNPSGNRLDQLGKIVCEFFNVCESVSLSTTDSLENWMEDVLSYLEPSVEKYSRLEKETLLLIIGHEYARRYKEFLPCYLTMVKRLI